MFDCVACAFCGADDDAVGSEDGQRGVVEIPLPLSAAETEQLAETDEFKPVEISVAKSEVRSRDWWTNGVVCSPSARSPR